MAEEYEVSDSVREHCQAINDQVIEYLCLMRGDYVRKNTSPLWYMLCGVCYAAPFFGWYFEATNTWFWVAVVVAAVVYLLNDLRVWSLSDDVQIATITYADLQNDPAVVGELLDTVSHDAREGLEFMIDNYPDLTCWVEVMVYNGVYQEILVVYWQFEEGYPVWVYEESVNSLLEERYSM